jgi:hypothetical protein
VPEIKIKVKLLIVNVIDFLEISLKIKVFRKAGGKWLKKPISIVCG